MSTPCHIELILAEKEAPVKAEVISHAFVLILQSGTEGLRGKEKLSPFSCLSVLDAIAL